MHTDLPTPSTPSSLATPPTPASRSPGLETAAALLRLLNAGAPVAEFQALRDRYPGELRPLVDVAVADALRLRAQLEERRRREAELAALYETAGDLSALRDLEAVLRAIVRRVRALLGTDAAYLMLNDTARGDTYMRVTDGIRTEAFQQARLAMGAGLGGLVAKTGVPYHTTDYFSDDRFAHTIDGVVRGEGVIAIQGAPLKRGEKVIGVLFAANRTARPFSSHEVALLVSLANHAAIAIENATLFQEVQRAVDDLTEANAVIQAHSASLEQAAALHERLTSIVLHGGGLTDLAQHLSELLGGGVLVLDSHHRTLAAAGGHPLITEAQATGELPHRAATARTVRKACQASVESRGTRRISRTNQATAACATPIMAGAEVLGVLVLLQERPDPCDMRSLERAAVVIALMLLTERTVAETEHRLRGEILEDLLGAPHQDLDGVRRRAALMGLDLARSHVVLAARCRDGKHRRKLADAAASYAGQASGLAGKYRGNLILLLPGERDPADAARAVARHLSQAVGDPVTVGAAAAAGGVDTVVDAHRDASQCLDVLLALDRDGEAASPAELGVYGLLLSQTGQEELRHFVRRTIGPVLDYDRRRSCELVQTLLAYFACDGGLTRTATELFIHVNTLYQRIERITSLLGPQWRHGDQALQVHLALKIHTAISGVRSAG